MNGKDRLDRAQRIHAEGMRRVNSTPEPEGQKYPIGTRVTVRGKPNIARNGTKGTVLFTYAHAFPQVNATNVVDYAVDVDEHGYVAWWHESQLTLANEIPDNQMFSWVEIRALFEDYDNQHGTYPESRLEGESMHDFFVGVFFDNEKE
jgi:hypothetical protein